MPLALDQLERARGVEAALEHDRRALPPGEDRLHVPAAAMELRQHLQDDVVGPDAGREVEREVRPEAVRVREQRALRLAGRAARCRSGAADRRRSAARRARGARPSSSARRARARARAPPRRASRCSSSTRKTRGLGVVELVGDLGRREPPRDRVQDRARLRAREHQRDVLAGVAGQRRDARRRARAPRASSSERASSSAYVQRRPRSTIATRSGVMPRAVAEDPVDRQLRSLQELRRRS